MTDYTKTMTDLMKAVTDALPTVTATSSGYEIRTKILGLAQHQAHRDYEYNISDELGVRTTVNDAGETVTSVTYPNAAEVLKIADQFNDFVSGTRNKTKTDK
jgi:hypothetical protein